MRKVALIIPAYNEEHRIGVVLQAATRCKLANEVIVVTDGCTDGTAKVARTFPGVKVVELKENRGKGGAMTAGVRSTAATIVAFVDADLIGLTPDHIDTIIAPVLDGTCQMCTGVFRGGKFLSNSSQIIFPYISGQRAMTKSLFDRIPNVRERGYGVEITIHDFLKRRKDILQRRVVLRGISNSYKEQKFGLVQGFQARKKMYSEMYRARASYRRMQRLEKFKPKEKHKEPAILLDFEQSRIAQAIVKMREKNKEARARRPRN